jgi:hypothetical protein
MNRLYLRNPGHRSLFAWLSTFIVHGPLLGLLLSCLAAATPLNAAEPAPDDSSYVPLFDGKTLDHWSGDEPYWSVRDGAILGQITENTRIDKNRFLIYQGDVPADFELIAEYRVSLDGNSGINYRSEVVEGVDFHALRGYQCDIDGRNRYTGSNYEERRRTTLAAIGESVIVPEVPEAGSLRYVAGNRWTASVPQGGLESADELRAKVKSDDWNEVRIVAKGNVLSHYVNGALTSRVVDNDSVNRRFNGKLGIQVHVGPPMTIEYRNLRLRPLDTKSRD